MIELPWPPSKLSPNSSHQGDYRGKAEAACKYRADCYTVALKALRGHSISHDGPVMLDISFHEPTRHRRDLDNLLAMTKRGIDAVAQVLGVDDYRFEYTIRRGPIHKGGKVVVRL